MGYYAYETKTVAEELPLDIGFVLATGVTISSAAASANEWIHPDILGEDVTDDVLASATGTIDDDVASVTVVAGEHGKRYLIRITATLSDGTTPERLVLVLVDDYKRG